MESRRTIVFGPTGSVGSVVAVTAEEFGCKVFLAMRDTRKPIPGLTVEQERDGRFERVYADLTAPETVAKAIRKTEADRAFIYLAHGSVDSMISTLEAMKLAGVRFVVFLSSYTINKDRAMVTPQETIPYAHAQVEIHLDHIFGQQNYVAIRAGSFATNALQWRAGISSGQLPVYCPGAKLDFIVAEDIGRVGGSLLADGRQKGQSIVYLLGPQLLSQEEAIQTIAHKIGKDVQINPLSRNEQFGRLTLLGLSPDGASYVLNKLAEAECGEDVSSTDFYNEGVRNVAKYLKRPATGFEQWVNENINLFS